jgi:hypothetical protein
VLTFGARDASADTILVKGLKKVRFTRRDIEFVDHSTVAFGKIRHGSKTPLIGKERSDLDVLQPIVFRVGLRGEKEFLKVVVIPSQRLAVIGKGHRYQAGTGDEAFNFTKWYCTDELITLFDRIC